MKPLLGNLLSYKIWAIVDYDALVSEASIGSSTDTVISIIGDALLEAIIGGRTATFRHEDQHHLYHHLHLQWDDQEFISEAVLGLRFRELVTPEVRLCPAVPGLELFRLVAPLTDVWPLRLL